LQQGPLDIPGDMVHGSANSRLKTEVSSQFANVLIIIDSRQTSQYPLGALADYVAMLVLTRTSLSGCNELPSVTDLLSHDCGTRERPQSITEADRAYLKALYASSLESNTSLARGEIHDRMLRQIVGR